MTRGRCTCRFEQHRNIRTSLIKSHCPSKTGDARKMAPAQGKWELAPGELVRAEGLEPPRHGLKVRIWAGIRVCPLAFIVPIAHALPVLA